MTTLIPKYDQGGTGAVNRAINLKLAEIVSVKDFGAVGDGTTNDQPAISAAITALLASGGNTLYFPEGTYYVATPVVVVFDQFYSLRFTGSSTASMASGGVQGGSILTGAAGIASIFQFTQPDLSVECRYSFECDHLSFKSSALGVTGPLRAIYSQIAGSAGRPFVVHNCDFRGFDTAIESNISGSTGFGLISGICQVTIRENNFIECVNSLKAVGKAAITNLDFSNNISEQGGRITSSANGFFGTIRICDNLFENQSNSVSLVGITLHATIQRNYFEGNSGFLFDISTTSYFSQVYLGNNIYSTSTGSTIYINFCNFFNEDNLSAAGIDLITNALHPNSYIAQTILNYNGTTAFNYLSQLAVPYMSNLPPATLTAGGYITVGGTTSITPIGTVKVETINGLGAQHTVATPLSANDVVVCQAFVRLRSGGSGGLSVTLISSTGGYLANSELTAAMPLSTVGKWVFMILYIKTPSASATSFDIRWDSQAGSQYDVTNTYVYKTSAPATGDPIYIYMP